MRDHALADVEEDEIHTDQWEKVEKARTAIARRIALASAEKRRRGGAILEDADFERLFGDRYNGPRLSARVDYDAVMDAILASGVESLDVQGLTTITEGEVSPHSARIVLSVLWKEGRLTRRRMYVPRNLSGHASATRRWIYTVVR